MVEQLLVNVLFASIQKMMLGTMAEKKKNIWSGCLKRLEYLQLLGARQVI